MKPTNPYTTLRNECREWARKIVYPRKINHFYWDNVIGDHVMRLLYERTVAANELGYAVQIEAKHGDNKLHVVFIKRAGDPPWTIQP